MYLEALGIIVLIDWWSAVLDESFSLGDGVPYHHHHHPQDMVMCEKQAFYSRILGSASPWTSEAHRSLPEATVI